ncbi:MAG: SDR family NAD(P)-dependent oxidoreductase [Flavobacteriaceae bacterium]
MIADFDAESGASVVRALTDAGARASFERVDVGDEALVEAFAAKVAAEHGTPAALVNSAGILQGAVRVTDMPVAEYDAILKVNLRGAMLMSRTVGRLMMAAGTGAIVNLCSISSTRPSAQPAYAASKAGLKMMTEVMAAEFGQGACA